MISTDIQSIARTIPGQRYLLVIYHPTMAYLTPHVRFNTPMGVWGCPLSPENSHDTFNWYEDGFKYITFIAWADELVVNYASQFTFWRLTPIRS